MLGFKAKGFVWGSGPHTVDTKTPASFHFTIVPTVPWHKVITQGHA